MVKRVMKKHPEESGKNESSLRVVRPRVMTCGTRQGVVTFWALVSVPVFMLMFCVVVEIGNLWMARIQLKNALESAALAAVKTWGDARGGDTTLARTVGNRFASACVINGVSVDLSTLPGGLNDNFADVDNDNASCTGTLVFGSITADDPEYAFDSCVTGGCGVNANVLIDASSNGNLNSENDWGISFQPNAQTDPNSYITRVVIRLPGNDGDTTLPYFDFSGGGPIVATSSTDNVAANRVRCASTQLNCGANQGDSQADLFGITASDMSFGTMSVANFGDAGGGNRLECSAAVSAISAAPTKILVIEFDPSTFQPGERFRFGANVNGGGISPFDGDVIGGDALPAPAEVTVCFSTGDVITGHFEDTNDRLLGQEANCSNVTFAPTWGQCPTPGRRGMIINGADANPAQRLRPDQPPPPSNGNGNNGQSLVSFNISGNGGQGLAVRARATFNVPSVCESLFGLPLGSFTVTAEADAIYECIARRPRLYHIDDGLPDFTCSTNCP